MGEVRVAILAVILAKEIDDMANVICHRNTWCIACLQKIRGSFIAR